MHRTERIKKRKRLKKRKVEIAKVSARSTYKPTVRIKWRCHGCHEIVIRKETENPPARCPFCQVGILFENRGKLENAV